MHIYSHIEDESTYPKIEIRVSPTDDGLCISNIKGCYRYGPDDCYFACEFDGSCVTDAIQGEENTIDKLRNYVEKVDWDPLKTIPGSSRYQKLINYFVSGMCCSLVYNYVISEGHDTIDNPFGSIYFEMSDTFVKIRNKLCLQALRYSSKIAIIYDTIQIECIGAMWMIHIRDFTENCEDLLIEGEFLDMNDALFQGMLIMSQYNQEKIKEMRNLHSQMIYLSDRINMDKTNKDTKPRVSIPHVTDSKSRKKRSYNPSNYMKRSKTIVK